MENIKKKNERWVKENKELFGKLNDLEKEILKDKEKNKK